MKKIWLIFPILCFTFLLSGCARAIPEKEAAALLVDHLVYQKSEKKFTENFQDGEDLSNAFQTNEQAFQKSFTEGLLADSEIPQAEAEEIAELLLNQMQKEATYEIKEIDDSDTIRHVTYGVKGLDFTGMMAATSEKLVTELLADETISKDQDKVVSETVRFLKETIPQTKAKTKAINVMLEMKPEKGKWQIVAGQTEQLNNLYLAFVAGVSDQEALLAEMTTVMEETAKEVQEQLD
ncbi:DUF5105 domain-containing protein [Enterococcus songbeiensis]|uniref:DUF5105 domain-containing protein n=1 Tax=Enterococcus songbeiensis TaxID=2559927 RepID=UPI0010F8B08B|nr:DUF5105 domain-containing protein [Enterococcus songbeiensis]